MKPSYQHLGGDQQKGSFLCYEVKSPKFGFHWHYHPECEISFVKRGFGTRLVGDHVANFEAGDLLLLGSDLPHTLISDEFFNQSDEDMEVVVIQFDPAIFLSQSSIIKELTGITQMLHKATRGLSFPKVNQQLASTLERIPQMDDFHRYTAILEVLHELSQASFTFLASSFYAPNKNSNTEARIGKVCSYIHDHFCDNIKIEALADLANMNGTAFCRFFKKMTGKTAINYINDLRIGKACNMLQNGAQTVSEIAYLSGFNSIPHFNRYFQKIKHCNPTHYRKQYQNA